MNAINRTLSPTITTLDTSGKLEQMPTYSDVGVAPKNHASNNTDYGVSSPTNYGHSMAISTTPIVAGTATKLQTSRTIATSGGATGTATSFDGSYNITILITKLNPNYLSSATPIDKGGTGATNAATALTNLGAAPQTRTINQKSLSSNITLTANDIGTIAINSNRISIPLNADLNEYTTISNYCYCNIIQS